MVRDQTAFPMAEISTSCHRVRSPSRWSCGYRTTPERCPAEREPAASTIGAACQHPVAAPGRARSMKRIPSTASVALPRHGGSNSPVAQQLPSEELCRASTTYVTTQVINELQPHPSGHPSLGAPERRHRCDPFNVVTRLEGGPCICSVAVASDRWFGTGGADGGDRSAGGQARAPASGGSQGQGEQTSRLKTCGGSAISVTGST